MKTPNHPASSSPRFDDTSRGNGPLGEWPASGRFEGSLPNGVGGISDSTYSWRVSGAAMKLPITPDSAAVARGTARAGSSGWPLRVLVETHNVL
jgi:hypothetical protein